MDPVIEGTSAAAELKKIEETSAALAEFTEIEETSAALAEYREIEGTSAAKDPRMDEILLLMDRLIKETEDAESTESGKRTHWPKNSIFRVPAHIRSSRESNFEPKLVSIGPYYHGQENLQRMEDLKIQCIQEILKMLRIAQRRIAFDCRAIYVSSVRSSRGVPIHDVTLREFMVSGSIARTYYKEEFDHSPENFVKMLFLDSCFIIRTMLAFSEQVQESMSFLDVHIKEIRSDLLLLDNQIPLFFIKEVYQWFLTVLRMENLPSFNTVLEPFICLDMPWRINHDAMSNKNAAHLLDLYWRCSLSPRMYLELTSSEKDLLEQIEYPLQEWESIREDKIDSPRRYTTRMVLFLLARKVSVIYQQYRSQILSHYYSDRSNSSKINRSNNALMVMANAIELQQMAGIEFEKFKDEGYLDVNFSKRHGIMRMPRLKIDSRQITLLRNLIAFENCISPRMRIISCYMKLMDALIDSEMDVKLLQKCSVIYNTLRSHEMAATFFNDIGDFSFTDDNANPFSGLYKDVQKYYNSSCNRRLASLRHNYFSSPWTGISVVAATILLILSVLQTFYAIYGYHHPKN